MAIKLIAIDIDGTLVNHQNIITPEVKTSVMKAREKGVRVVLATGRPYIGLLHFLQELELQQQDEYCITYNGAWVQQTDKGDCIAEVSLSFDDYVWTEQLSRKLNVHFQALTGSALYTANKNISRYTVHEVSLTGIPLRYRRVEEMDRSLIFPKVMMVDSPEILDRAILLIPPEAFHKYTIVKSAPFYLEILNKSANKGAGLKILADRLGLSREEVMAIGDQQNDVEMLEFAGIGVAMGNAIDKVKAVSQFVTKTNSENGVAYAIRKFVLS